MTFIHSVFLFATAVTAIPLLIHLLNRQKLNIVPFSSLRFLKELQQHTFKRIRLKQILLLLIRSLILFLIAFTFARPALKGKVGAVQSHSSTSIVILLDNSASMGLVDDNGVSRFEKAKTRAMGLLDLLGPDDEVGLIGLGHPVEAGTQGFSTNTARVRELIQQTPQTSGGTDFIPGILLADEWLAKSSKANREIYVITDGRGKLERTEPVLFKKKSALFWVLTEDTKFENAAIQKLEIKNQLFEPKKPIEVQAQVHAEEDLNHPVLAVLWFQGMRVAQSLIDFSGGQTQLVHFKFVPEQTGWVSGWMELEDDRLLADNKSYFSFLIPDQIQNLVLSPGEQDALYLKTVFGLHENRIPFRMILPAQISQVDLRKFDLLWLINDVSFSAMEWDRIQKWWQEGKTIVLIPGDHWDIRAGNEMLNKFISPEGGNGIQAVGVDRLPPTSGVFVSLEKMDFQHPLFANLFEHKPKEVIPTQIKQWITYRIPTGAGVHSGQIRTIVQQKNGSPFLVESRGKKGKLFLFSTAFRPEWTDLVYQGLFPSLITRLVYYAVSHDEAPAAHFVGDDLTLQIEPQNAGGTWQWVSQSNDKIQIQPKVTPDFIRVSLADPKEPGIYTLQQNNRKIQSTAVNIDVDEMFYHRILVESLEKVIPNVQILKPGENIFQKVNQFRYGREIWRPVLFLVLLFLLLEMWISHVPRSERIVSESTEPNALTGIPSPAKKL